MSEAGFRDLGLSEMLLAAIDALGFVEPTPIQREAIPPILEGKDLIGKAETGTGKTLAFCAPMYHHLDAGRVAVQALVLCPTRELAQQVEESARQLGETGGFRSALLVGGVHQSQQILALREGAQVVVGTPGRILDFLREGTLSLGWAHYVVLDEADRMLDVGFIDDVSAILDRTPKERQMLLFSATVPPRLQRLTWRFMNQPVTVSTTPGLATVPEIRQLMLRSHPRDKEGFVLDILDRHPLDTCIIFCNTRRAVIDLDRTLWGLGYAAGSLHGDIDQDKRFRVLEAFKNREILTLVATDVAGRGLDIEDVTRIVNYDVPEEVETYVHRIGRTGRAGDEGESITFVSREDQDYWRRIVRSTGFDIEELDWEPTRPRSRSAEDQRRRSSRGQRDGRRGGPARRGGEDRGAPRGRRSTGPRGHSPAGSSRKTGARRSEKPAEERRSNQPPAKDTPPKKKRKRSRRPPRAKKE